MIQNLLSFFTALFLSLMCFPPFIKFMERKKLLDSGGGRKIHKGYTAHMGGLVIFFSFALSAFIWFIVANGGISWELMQIMLVLFFVVLLGIRDDLNSLTPAIKILCEIFLGILCCYFDFRLKSFYGVFGIYELPIGISYILTILFIIVVMNAFNLIDGIDGQAGLQAILFFFFILIIHLLHGRSWESLVCSSMMGSIAGFLYYNWQPAKVFMGDTGSLFIGFTVAIISIATMNFLGMKLGDDFFARPVLHINVTLLIPTIKSALCLPIAFFFVPLADTLRVFSYRIGKKRSPFHPDKKHIHHLLLSVGYNNRQCSIITSILSLSISLISVPMAFLLSDIYFFIYLAILYFLYVSGLHLFIRHKIENTAYPHQIISQKNKKHERNLHT